VDADGPAPGNALPHFADNSRGLELDSDAIGAVSKYAKHQRVCHDERSVREPSDGPQLQPREDIRCRDVIDERKRLRRELEIDGILHDVESPPKKLKAAEQKAKALVAELNKANGKNFAQLAKTKSDDEGTKGTGGELDWTDGSNLVKEFTDAMVKLQKGGYTKEPVKTRFGYHIILVEDVRPIQFPPYEQVKERVQQQLIKEMRDKKIEELRAAAKVE
jgi:peptidyl-prolyl cis-trans isomerase C